MRVDHSDAGLYLWATRGEDAWATIDALAARVGILPIYLEGTYAAFRKGSTLLKSRDVGARITIHVGGGELGRAGVDALIDRVHALRAARVDVDQGIMVPSSSAT